MPWSGSDWRQQWLLPSPYTLLRPNSGSLQACRRMPVLLQHRQNSAASSWLTRVGAKDPMKSDDTLTSAIYLRMSLRQYTIYGDHTAKIF